MAQLVTVNVLSELCSSLQMVTVKVSNVSLEATERDLKEFFSFSGDIAYLETQRSVFFDLHFHLNYVLTDS